MEDLCAVNEHEKQDNCLEGDFSLVEVPSQGADSLNFSLEQVQFQKLRVITRAHNLCHDNRQLIVIAINRNHSASKIDCN